MAKKLFIQLCIALLIVIGLISCSNNRVDIPIDTKKDITVEFYDGENLINSFVVKSGEFIDVPAITIPDGYYLAGWVSSDFSSVIQESIKTTRVSYPTIYYACYFPEEYNSLLSINSIGEISCKDKAIREISIPAIFQGMVVKGIANNGFEGCEFIEKIDIADNVSVIGDYAFSGCINLKEIIWPKSLTRIGWHAFRGCSALESAILPKGLRVIDCFAFQDCKSLKKVVIPDTVTSIEQKAFAYCSSLKEVELGKGLTKLPMGLFECSGLTSITFPDNIIDIGEYCCFGSKNLTYVVLPDSLENIPENAFDQCEKLADIELPMNLKYIEKKAFYECALSELVLPEGLKYIGDEAFAGNEFSEVIIPASVSGIVNNPFVWCAKLENIFVADGNPYYKSMDGILIDTVQMKLQVYPSGRKNTSVKIPMEIKGIGQDAFSLIQTLTEIHIPNSVSVIDYYAFSGCWNLADYYCETSSKPIGWDDEWNGNTAYNKNVHWGQL